MQARQNILRCREKIAPRFLLEVTRSRNHRFMSYRQARGSPCVETTVEDTKVLVAEEFEEPEQASRAHSSGVIVNDDFAVRVDALGLNQMLDDPEERIQRLLSRVDKADPKDIEAARARYGAVGVGFRRPEIQDNQVRVLKVARKFFRRP